LGKRLQKVKAFSLILLKAAVYNVYGLRSTLYCMYFDHLIDNVRTIRTYRWRFLGAKLHVCQ